MKTAFTVILAFGFIVTHAAGQEGGYVRLSTFLGDTLDRYERELFDLGLDYDGYRWAVFSMEPDSELTAWVRIQRKYDAAPFPRKVPRYGKYGELIKDIQKQESILLQGRYEGSDVRISLRSGDPVEGELFAVGDSVVLVRISGNELLPVDRSTITSCVLPGGSHIGQGMGIGLVTGASIGLLAGLGSGDDPPGFLSLSAGEKGALGAIGLGLAGLLVGTVIGVASGTDDEFIDHTDTHLLKVLSKYPLGEPSSFK